MKLAPSLALAAAALSAVGAMFAGENAGSCPSTPASCCAAADSTAQTIPATQLQQLPQVTKRVAPLYPADLRKDGVQGFAKVEMVVDAQGNVQEARLVVASHPEFGDRAVLAAQLWKFDPATDAAGKPVAVRVAQAFDFTLPQMASLDR